MRNIIAIATVSLAGLSFAPAAFAQRHSDTDAVDHARPDRITMQRERAERPSFEAQRAPASERYQDGRADAPPSRPGDTARPAIEISRMSPSTADAIRRAEERGTSGGENDGPVRNHATPAAQSSNVAHPDAQPVQRMSPTVAAAIQRIAEHGTSGGEDGAARPHDAAPTHSDNRTPQSDAQPVQHMSPTVAAAIQRIAEHGTSGGEDRPDHSHDPKLTHSDNRTN